MREDSAAKSIQRTKMRRVVPCRVTAPQQLATNTQRTRPPERENSRRRISRHCVPNLLFSQKQRRAEFCSTAPARIVLFVSQAWNGMGTRFAPCRFPLRPPRTRNDSRPRSMSRSQSQRQRSVWSLSHCVQSSNHGQFSNLFLRIEQRRDGPGSDAFGRDNLFKLVTQVCAEPVFVRAHQVVIGRRAPGARPLGRAPHVPCPSQCRLRLDFR